jgi:hypothetical protein
MLMTSPLGVALAETKNREPSGEGEWARGRALETPGACRRASKKPGARSGPRLRGTSWRLYRLDSLGGRRSPAHSGAAVRENGPCRDLESVEPHLATSPIATGMLITPRHLRRAACLSIRVTHSDCVWISGAGISWRRYRQSTGWVFQGGLQPGRVSRPPSTSVCRLCSVLTVSCTGSTRARAPSRRQSRSPRTGNLGD